MAFTNPQGRTQSSLADINITPLVDVVLVLLIIFMITAPVLQSGIEVSVPKTKTVKEITEERLVISIDKDQRVFLGNDGININEIGAKLRQKIRDPQNQYVFVRADENVPFGAFATVMDAVKQSGITNVSIVTQPLNSNAGKPSDLFRTRPLGSQPGLVVGLARGSGRGDSRLCGDCAHSSRRRLGLGRRRRCHGRAPGHYNSSPLQAGGCAKCAGERFQGAHPVAASATSEG